jgi:hypothetical protein
MVDHIVLCTIKVLVFACLCFLTLSGFLGLLLSRERCNARMLDVVLFGPEAMFAFVCFYALPVRFTGRDFLCFLSGTDY